MNKETDHTLADKLQIEITRVRELQFEYRNLPNNAGWFAVANMEEAIRGAIKALAENDAVDCIWFYEFLKGFRE